MRILFIHSEGKAGSAKRPLDAAESIQLGISYISSLLKHHGHETRLAVLSEQFATESRHLAEKRVVDFEPQLVAYTAVSTQYPVVAALAQGIRDRYPRVFQLIGGPHASLNADAVIAGPFDAVCVGEGEHATLELIAQLERGETPHGIPNLWIKRGTAIEKNAARPWLTELDTLPFPDREMWNEWLEPGPRPRHVVLLGRGCPFECTYCCNHKLKRLARGPYVRFRSPENILSEIRVLVERVPALRELYLEVETIGVKRQWVAELCDKLAAFNAERQQPISFGANLRVTSGCDFDEMFASMHRANFTFVNIGLESGSERVRSEILNRDYSNEDVLRTVKQARAHGLRVAFFNLIGVPGETVADFEMTVEMNRACRPDWHFTSIFYPYPGTHLHQICMERGLINGQSAEGAVERVKSVLELPEFPKRAVERLHALFDYYVYRGRLPLYRIVPKLLRVKLHAHPKLMSRLRQVLRHPLLRRVAGRLGG